MAIRLARDLANVRCDIWLGRRTAAEGGASGARPSSPAGESGYREAPIRMRLFSENSCSKGILLKNSFLDEIVRSSSGRWEAPRIARQRTDSRE